MNEVTFLLMMVLFAVSFILAFEGSISLYNYLNDGADNDAEFLDMEDAYTVRQTRLIACAMRINNKEGHQS